jgi:hypothetical protein
METKPSDNQNDKRISPTCSLKRKWIHLFTHFSGHYPRISLVVIALDIVRNMDYILTEKPLEMMMAKSWLAAEK